MKNNPGSSPLLGPRPGIGVRPLSRSRAAILERLRDQPEPVTQAALVTATGLHPNTVRDHLDGLVRLGLVRRHAAEPSGRGRPAWLYEPTTGPAGNGYAGLAAALAAAIARTSARPRAEATAAGEAWGRELAESRGGTTRTPEEARSQVIELLDDLGFAPETGEDRPSDVRLTRCPLLEAAHRHPDVVCGVHLGIVRGALARHGADPTGAELLPFSEPGACRLVVPPLEGPR
ncbi:metalloregulator ArsR/SmtB family transcription factor [Nocardioides sp.]|uniref:helix-turn-helix transcriptional regulator n=1 Tax=Nocardioides sp. TaxID=35761 RepID=UPI00273390C6|nr:helix-turn-helix domain-containing protein [Nocardioides sp.]MDP3892395.1 helix-turn-helix domain-containing protein [Nocardioides sp.]